MKDLNKMTKQELVENIVFEGTTETVYGTNDEAPTQLHFIQDLYDQYVEHHTRVIEIDDYNTETYYTGETDVTSNYEQYIRDLEQLTNDCAMDINKDRMYEYYSNAGLYYVSEVTQEDLIERLEDILEENQN